MLSSLSKHTAYKILVSVLWFLVIIGLPLTSFPPLASLTGAIVAPFSAIPLALLLIIWFIPFLVERGKLPGEILPYLYFILAALLISALSFFLNGYYSRGRDFFDQTLRAFITVGIGLSFYLIFTAYPRDEKTLHRTLQFITIMGALIIPWTLFEVILLRQFTFVQGFPQWVINFRNQLSVQSPNLMFTNRVSGFAYEPSWFVRIFNLVLFPLWLSAVFQRQSLFKFRLWIFQIEDFLMLAGLVVFGFSSPRIGLVAFLASLAYLGFLIIRRFYRWFTGWVLKRRKKAPKHLTTVKLLLAVLIVVVMFVAVFGALFAYINAASAWDNRFELMLEQLDTLDIFPLTERRLIYAARSLAFFERMVFWFGGWHIFNDFPFGVGLGNAGLYFFDRMPGAGLESYEVRNLVYRASYLPNTKNMWTRLLSETGFVGLTIYVIWLYVLWRSTSLSRKSQSKILRIMGLAGRLFLLALLFENFSMDSFAMPDQWVMAGLISAAGLLARRELAAKDKAPASELA